MMEAKEVKKEENREKTMVFDIEIKTDSEKRLMGYAAAVLQSSKMIFIADTAHTQLSTEKYFT